MFQLAFASLDLGNAREALQSAHSLQSICEGPADGTWRIRAEWIEARARLALGSWSEGIAGLNNAREALVGIGALGAAAHAHLELALAYADANQWTEASQIASQAFGTLAQAGLTGQALLALRTVARAAQANELSHHLLQDALSRLASSAG
jgi:hypothetical protein